ncbi:Chaperone protein ClpB [Aliiroseovarius pelagivivens]|uniref:Chaperone protein ClpB n=1 Tax=Aliiroseovarius pelagivivens TaxID=1639690 RepID=A0A2R8AM92_9RHOB|nr:AAA family ATPase [Aliiroseovarius pelagivivens]SPF77120.1 Chaperone protein ClpB [Aliiroseovarius pelagivivens]
MTNLEADAIQVLVTHRDPPSWYEEFSSAVTYADHIILSGNIRDLYPSFTGQGDPFPDFEETLWDLLHAQGVRVLLLYDPVSGLKIHKASSDKDAAVLKKTDLLSGKADGKTDDIRDIHAAVADFEEFPIALLLDYASHFRTHDEVAYDDCMVAIDRKSRERRYANSGAHLNPTIWVADHPADLPDWFVLQNASVREIQLELPNLEDRYFFGRHLAEQSRWTSSDPTPDQERLLQQFAFECDGGPLRAMQCIRTVAQEEGFHLTHISDAVRVFRTGARRNPWASPVLRERMKRANEILETRIKGQHHALERTLDILARSILGLSGAQSGSMHTRPRGALFLVGPTGVGKTELAKAITELLFGDETACHRFDMSEFMEESSVARLIGAPPGHHDHEKGGQLINAANRRPFSVFLFDEVEKAHPRVLDLFLQILDEGRLADARGSTAYFSEALIIFTSNIGIVQDSRASNMGMNVLPSDSYSQLSAKIMKAVEEHFRNDLKRPELLNRIGQNVVAFDFLKPSGMAAIFETILERVLKTVEQEHGVRISLTDAAYYKLKQVCTQDYFYGGRGIANRIEAHFINPLARQFFESGIAASLQIVDVHVLEDKTTLEIEGDSSSAFVGTSVSAPHGSDHQRHKTRLRRPAELHVPQRKRTGGE